MLFAKLTGIGVEVIAIFFLLMSVEALFRIF